MNEFIDNVHSLPAGSVSQFLKKQLPNIQRTISPMASAQELFSFEGCVGASVVSVVAAVVASEESASVVLLAAAEGGTAVVALATISPSSASRSGESS